MDEEEYETVEEYEDDKIEETEEGFEESPDDEEYYQANGAKSADTYRGLLSDAEFFHEDQAADYVRALYDDLRPLITDFNNLIRAQH